MNLVSILTDELTGSVYGYAIKSGKEISYVGNDEQSKTWALWANAQIKSVGSIALPFGISGGDFRIPNDELAENLGIDNKSAHSEKIFAIKSKSIKHDIDKTFFNPVDFVISGSSKSKLNIIDFKAQAFKHDQKLSSFISEFKSSKHSFDLDTNRFNCKQSGIDRGIFHDNLRTKISQGFERRLGNMIVDSRESLITGPERKSIGINHVEYLQQKELGPKLGSGTARLGRRSLSAVTARFDPDAVDADADKLVQEGTPFERPDTRMPKPEVPGMPSKRTGKPAVQKERQARQVRAAVGKPKKTTKRTSAGPQLARYPGQLDDNGNMMPRRKFDEEKLQAVYDSFTKPSSESTAEKYRRVASEFEMSPHDVEAHINEMHRGSRLRLPFVQTPESAGISAGEAAKPAKRKPMLTDKEIYDRRMSTGITLEQLARELGVGRSDIRRAEQRHAATLRAGKPIDRGPVRGMTSRRKPGTTLPERERRMQASVSRTQTVPAASGSTNAKKSNLFARVGTGKVGPNDGKFHESLSDEDKKKAENALRELEKRLTVKLKGGKKTKTKKNPNPGEDEFGSQYFSSWWKGEMLGSEKEKLRGGRNAARPPQDQFTSTDITHLQLLLDDAIARGTLKTVAVDKDDKPKLNADGTPELSEAELVQRMLDDMQVLIRMRDKNNFEMIEHLHPESQKVIAEAVTGKKGMRKTELKKIGLGEESSVFARARGFESGLASQVEKKKKLYDTRRRFLRVNPERLRKRELREQRKAGKKARRGKQLIESDPLLALEQKKLRSLAARRQLASKFRKKRDAAKIEERIKSNKSDGEKMVQRMPDGSIKINDRFAEALAFVSREYAKDESKGRAAQRRQAISNLWENTGYNNEPVLITKDEVQGLIEAGWTPIVRGTGNEKVKGEAYVEQFLTNPDRFVPGQGGEVHGFGEYFTDDPSSWGGYRGGSGDRHTILALIPPSAAVVDKQTLKREQASMHKITNDLGTKIQELGGKEAASKMTSEELAAELRSVLTKNHAREQGTVSHAIVDKVISQLEDNAKSGKDDVKVKEDAVEALDFLRKASGTDEEGRFAPIVGVSLERSTSNVVLLHDRSAIAAVHVPLEDTEAQKLAKGQPVAQKMSRSQMKAKGVVDVSGWTKIGGQMGSNAGGTYADSSGTAHYVKQPATVLQAENEVLASQLYNLAGVQTPEIRLGDESGQPRVVSKMRTDLSSASTRQHNDAIADTFVVNAWLGNWDAVLNNNTQVDQSGAPVVIDTGGALLFRANAGRKGTGGSTAFGDVAGEMDTLRNPSVNPAGARVFGSLTPDQIKTQVTRLRQITPDQIRKTVDTMISDMGERKRLADTLIARQKDIIARFG